MPISKKLLAGPSFGPAKKNGSLKKDEKHQEVERVRLDIPVFRTGKIKIKKGDIGEVLESVFGPHCLIRVKFPAGTVVISRFWTISPEEDLETLMKKMGREMRERGSKQDGSSLAPWM